MNNGDQSEASAEGRACERCVGTELVHRRHHLPHWQQGGAYYSVTVRCLRPELTPQSRQLVLETLRYDHGKRYELVAAVVMPDHMHLVLHPLAIAEGQWHELGQILKLIKGVSARRINVSEGTTGSVWHSESYDRIIRDDDEFRRFVDYVVTNPVRRELVNQPEEYPYTIWPGDLMEYRPYLR